MNKETVKSILMILVILAVGFSISVTLLLLT